MSRILNVRIDPEREARYKLACANRIKPVPLATFLKEGADRLADEILGPQSAPRKQT